MSMTREEAIKTLQWYVDDAGISWEDFTEAFDMALNALRPVTREQVDKVWRGEWVDCSNGWMCSRCEYDNTYAKPFCPNCGAPMTGKAVQMVMERLEVLKDGKGN